jgi:tetratricopeptide (TPR) repeat protein
VNNLLMQAYVGEGLLPQALKSFDEAARLSPKDEKLYDFAADACTDHHDYELGLRMVGRGLTELPDSARLHYERAMFLARLDRLAEAKPEFARAAALSPGSYISYLAQIQDALYEDRYAEAIRLLRDGIRRGDGDYRLLSLLGTVLLRQGAAPGTAEFAEARRALEESAKERPEYSATQIALGKLDLMDGRPGDAVEHLEIGRRLEPNSTEVYAGLASAYLRLGEREKARECQRELLRLSSEKRR